MGGLRQWRRQGRGRPAGNRHRDFHARRSTGGIGCDLSALRALRDCRQGAARIYAHPTLGGTVGRGRGTGTCCSPGRRRGRGGDPADMGRLVLGARCRTCHRAQPALQAPHGPSRGHGLHAYRLGAGGKPLPATRSVPRGSLRADAHLLSVHGRACLYRQALPECLGRSLLGMVDRPLQFRGLRPPLPARGPQQQAVWLRRRHLLANRRHRVLDPGAARIASSSRSRSRRRRPDRTASHQTCSAVDARQPIRLLRHRGYPRGYPSTACARRGRLTGRTRSGRRAFGVTAGIAIAERCSVCGVTRFVVDCETLLRIAAGEIEVAAEHKLVAPTLVRSQALSALYEASRRGEISAAEGIERVTRINSLKVRFLGDKVLQRTAWRVADQLGWETTYDAEFVALTQLQADCLVTSDGELARAVSGLVKTATIDALRTA